MSWLLKILLQHTVGWVYLFELWSSQGVCAAVVYAQYIAESYASSIFSFLGISILFSVVVI